MATKIVDTWQEELAGECQKSGTAAPVYSIVSERRGGRTAWSATVTVNGQKMAARYWYDGQFLNHAREDVAEIACNKLRTSPGPRTFSNEPAGFAAAAAEEKVEPEAVSMPAGAVAVAVARVGLD